MSEVKATLQFLVDLPLYDVEKQYLLQLPPSGSSLDLKFEKLSNWKFEEVDNIVIQDIQDHLDDFGLTYRLCDSGLQ